MSVSPEPAAELRPSDRSELGRIVRVFAREWLRSGRRPPGAPHRACLLAPSAAWLRIRTGTDSRCALRLEADRPLYAALAELAVELAAHPPPLSAANLGLATFDMLALGHPLRVPVPAALVPGALGLAVRAGERFAVLSAAHTPAAPIDEVLTGLCTAAGLDAQAWRDPAVAVHAFVGEPFSSSPPPPVTDH